MDYSYGGDERSDYIASTKKMISKSIIGSMLLIVIIFLVVWYMSHLTVEALWAGYYGWIIAIGVLFAVDIVVLHCAEKCAGYMYDKYVE